MWVHLYCLLTQKTRKLGEIVNISFDLGIGAISGVSNSEVTVVQSVYSSIKGLIKIHNPSLLITVADIDSNVKSALKMATESNLNSTTLVLLPRSSAPKVLWMADLRSTALRSFTGIHDPYEPPSNCEVEGRVIGDGSKNKCKCLLPRHRKKRDNKA